LLVTTETHILTESSPSPLDSLVWTQLVAAVGLGSSAQRFDTCLWLIYYLNLQNLWSLSIRLREVLVF